MMHSAGSQTLRRLLWAALLVTLWQSAPAIRAAELEDARKLFLAGNYQQCIRASQKAVEDNEYDEEWRVLLARSLMTVGRYPEARTALTNALDRYTSSIRLRLLGYDVFRMNGEVARAKSMLADINYLAGSRTWAYRDPANLVTLGRAAVLLGADPKRVLENFFDAVKKADPDNRDSYLAAGELALNKHDFQLAATSFQQGLKKFPNDADMHFGLAMSFSSGNRQVMLNSLNAALRSNTNHIPSMLLMIDHLIDAEEYDGATELLDRVLGVNPFHPEAWAYRAVMEHVLNSPKGEARAREMAMRFWDTNPEVDYIIGKKLSQKYRFAEGSSYQYQALRFDPAYLPAKIQLAQDLLRLGKESEGWRLAEEVHKEDAYDVNAYNLVTLHESLAKFQTLTNQHFIVRMATKEAAIYGPRVLNLLERARERLCGKYGLELERPVTVEVFPSPKDFGVRTFGIPDNPGYLGVCFGSVITANSPASQAGSPANWEAVLWHEFCHVVTLELTRNRMPRWLSEGISVYEELQANPVWGQSMNPRYRQMILEGELAPVSEMSAAFLTPKSSFHLQFAYYQASLVVEFLVQRYGIEKLKLILHDLRQGIPINESIETHTAPMAEIESNFALFAKKRAEGLAPGLDWERPKSASSGRPGDREAPVPPSLAPLDFSALHPKNYYVLMQKAKQLIEEKKFEEAKAPLQILTEHYPNQSGGDSAWALLAMVHRALAETDKEREALSKRAAVDSEALDAYLRLMELESGRNNWNAVFENAERYIAVNPLIAPPYAHLARASEAIAKRAEAVAAYRLLLRLDPADPADVHYRLARLLKESGDPEARRHILQALEEAPRFRDAHRLLLELTKGAPTHKPDGF
ncbi:MAG: tetratricopeptide repeat protein [Verrucomicrobiota bacterium]